MKDLTSEDLEWFFATTLAKKTMFFVGLIERFGADSFEVEDEGHYWEKMLEGLRCLSFSASQATHCHIALGNEMQKARCLVEITKSKNPGVKLS